MSLPLLMLLLVVLLLVVLPMETNTDLFAYTTVVLVDHEVFSGMVHLVALSVRRNVRHALNVIVLSVASKLEAGEFQAFRPLPLNHSGGQW